MQIESLRVKSSRSWKVDEAAGRAHPKRPRAFEHHAKRWQYGMRAAAPGELVQIDHMIVSFPGTSVKNFTAACPTTGYLTAHAYSRATSHNAARFLEQTLHAMPFAIHSIQVDGGSEFRAAFEHARQQHYCHHRPHGGKRQNFQTPMAYYQSLKQAA